MRVPRKQNSIEKRVSLDSTVAAASRLSLACVGEIYEAIAHVAIKLYTESASSFPLRGPQQILTERLLSSLLCHNATMYSDSGIQKSRSGKVLSLQMPLLPPNHYQAASSPT